MSENSIMQISDFNIGEMTVEASEAIVIHNNIVSSMRTAASAMVTLCENLKRMRDTQHYRAIGFDKFEDYTEQACGIKKRQAYNYIQTYERLGGTFLQANANLGITKLQLLTDVTAPDRAEFVEENDLEGMSVSEIKKLIAEHKGFAEQISIFESDNASKDEEIKRLEEENQALRDRPVEVAVQQPSQEQIDAAVIEKTKDLEKSYKEKLKKAKEKEQKKAEAEMQKVIENTRKAAKAEAEAAYKAELEKAKQEEAAAQKRAEEIAAKLDKNADADLVKASLYFGEAQKQLDSFLEATEKITASNPDKGIRLKNVAADFLKRYLGKLV